MRKHVFGRQLGRDSNERKALFKTLASSLVLEERIHTTHAKAKAIRPYVEKLVTKSRKGDQAFRLIEPFLTKPAALKMVSELGPRFGKRAGGYTRIIYAGSRIADNAPVAVIEFVERGKALAPILEKKSIKKLAVSIAKKPAVKASQKEKKV